MPNRSLRSCRALGIGCTVCDAAASDGVCRPGSGINAGRPRAMWQIEGAPHVAPRIDAQHGTFLPPVDRLTRRLTPARNAGAEVTRARLDPELGDVEFDDAATG